MVALTAQLSDLVLANHILAREGVVDAFGHVSVRHPSRPDRFFLSCSRSPELVSAEDIMEFDLDCNPIDESGRNMYVERPIHGEIYKARPDVGSVVHNHAQEVIPFTVADVELRPLLHVAAPMGIPPVWDIESVFGATDLLVRTQEQGQELAGALGDGRAVLMRGHGATVVGSSLREAVLTAIYLMVNAKVQATAMQLGSTKFLSSEEIGKASETTFATMDRAWEYWARRVRAAQA
jgi:ribulose-5-phosphate 4-epimerase/fuculose-1-phosphate aldolase